MVTPRWFDHGQSPCGWSWIWFSRLFFLRTPQKIHLHVFQVQVFNLILMLWLPTWPVMRGCNAARWCAAALTSHFVLEASLWPWSRHTGVWPWSAPVYSPRIREVLSGWAQLHSSTLAVFDSCSRTFFRVRFQSLIIVSLGYWSFKKIASSRLIIPTPHYFLIRILKFQENHFSQCPWSIPEK